MATRTIIINQIKLPKNQTTPITVSLFYKLYYGGTWTQIASGVTLDLNGNMSPGIPLTLTVGTRYLLRAENELCGFEYEQWVLIPDLGCQCPVGYTLSTDHSYCYKLDVQPAQYIGGANPILMCHYTNSSQYGVFGSVFYKPFKYNIDGTWNILDATARPTILTTSLGMGGYNTGSFNTTIITSPNVWINTVAGVDSRLNKGGLWDCGSPSGSGQSTVEVLGFARQINIPASGTYYIGIGSDNFPTVKINGITIIQQNAATAGGANYFNNTGGNFLFRYWHVFPIQLQAGPNLIEMDVDNTSSIGILGFEIYNTDEATLTSITTEAGLNPYIVFTTRDVPPGSLSDIGNYSCAAYPGYSLVNDNGNYTCQFLFQQSPTGC